MVTVKTTFNESDEANYVAGDILMGVNRGRNFRDTAVLYRMNAQSNALEYAMKRNGIPYKVVGGMKFFDRAEVKDMLAYLCVLNNPLDDLRLRRIINNPPRGIGATTLDKVGALAESQGASLYEIIRNADLFPELKASSAKLLKFADLIDGLRRAGTELALPEFYDAVCDQTGYVKALEEKNDMESRGRIENVQELKSNILGFLEQHPEDATLSGFLNEIALYTDLDSVEAGDDCVTMMTIHSAKGLEFPVVYVVGMEEGIFPGASAQYDQEELEEERRLCYVAMTRAKEKLTLTNCSAADAVRPYQRQPGLPVPGGDSGGEHALGEQAGAPFRRYGARRHLRRRPVRGRLGQLPRPRRRLLEQRRRPQLPGPGPGAPAAPGLCPAGVLHPEERRPGGASAAITAGGHGGAHRLREGHGALCPAHGRRRPGGSGL